MNLFDFTEIPAEGDRWTRFAREFFQTFGFSIEAAPYRDSEKVSDLCATELLPGKFNQEPFRWLVSCRHKAATRTAVKESEEADILERLLRSRADGFIGFYSTPTSPTLETYLTELKDRSLIKDYRIIDARFLETHLASPGFARLVSCWFPNYAKTHPVLHFVGNEYLPILCEHCKKDLLKSLFTEDQQGVAVRLKRRKETPDAIEVIADVYVACKGDCDAKLQTKYCSGTLLSAAGWSALSDIVTPQGFLDRATSLLRQIGTDEAIFTTQAIEKEVYLLKALAQYSLRESANGENQRNQKIVFSDE